MFAIRDDREYVNQEDLTKAARKVGEAKKHESGFNFYQVSLLSSDPEAHHSEDGVLDVTFSMIHISLLFLYVDTLNLAMFFRTTAPLFYHSISSLCYLASSLDIVTQARYQVYHVSERAAEWYKDFSLS